MSKPATIVGLIGSNIMQSLSPALHEDAFAAHGIRGHYHLMDLDRLAERRLEHLLTAVKAVGFAGVNVTFPVKQTIMPLLDEVSSDAREIGAVNTVRIDKSGRTTGYNTDRSGFRRSVEDEFGRDGLRGCDVVLVGAGGAGRAVAFALMDLGAAHVAVYDVDIGRATATVADLMTHFGTGRCSYVEDLSEAIAKASAVINATPIGMTGKSGMPVPARSLRAHHIVADVIYSPMETDLIITARSKGCRVLTGGGMCTHQAADAFRHFTGLEPDIARMKQTFARALAARDATDTRARND